MPRSRRAACRNTRLCCVTRGGVAVPVATVKSPKGFEAACRCAVRRFPGTLKHLELPDWMLTDGRQRVELQALLRPEGAR